MFPVKGIQFALYFQHVVETIGSRAAVEVAVNAASWAHQLLRLKPVSRFPFMSTALAGLQRQLAKPKEKKIISVEMSALVQSVDSSLANLCLMAMAQPREFWILMSL